MKPFIVLMLAVPAVAFARSAAVPHTATLQVSAKATVSRAPDRVYIDVGVRTEARRPKIATTENAARIAKVLAAVRAAAGAGAHLSTADFSLTPQYQYHNDGKAPTLTGYSVTHLVHVRLDDLKRIGAVIDAASRAGANMQQNLRFVLRDPEAARLHAVQEAARRAHDTARALAAALNLRIVRIVSARQSGLSLVPPRPILHAQVTRMRPMAPATTIEARSIRVTATISLTVAVTPR